MKKACVDKRDDLYINKEEEGNYGLLVSDERLIQRLLQSFLLSSFFLPSFLLSTFPPPSSPHLTSLQSLLYSILIFSSFAIFVLSSSIPLLSSPHPLSPHHNIFTISQKHSEVSPHLFFRDHIHRLTDRSGSMHGSSKRTVAHSSIAIQTTYATIGLWIDSDSLTFIF